MKLIGEFDVIVVGGGTAGVVAAVAAARNGARVLLVERNSFLGGVPTAAMVATFLTFHNMRGEQIARGIAQEIVDRLQRRGGVVEPGHLFNPYGNAYSTTPFDPDSLKLVMFELVREAGVKLLLNTSFVEPLMAGNTVRGVYLHNKGGTGLATARVVIDCSGDGDVAALAGAPWELGSPNGKIMSMTLMFRMAGVDQRQLVQYLKDHPDQFLMGDDPYLKERINYPELISKVESLRDWPMLTGFFDLIKECQARGEFHGNRKRLVMYVTPNPNVVCINTSSVLNVDATNADQMTQATMDLHDQVHQLAAFFPKYVPGFQNAWMLDAAPMVGVRESRRIMGDYVLTKDDVIEAREFEDGIGKAAYCIDIHQGNGIITHYFIKDGQAFNIPYRCLLPQGIENLLVAGRCVSADSEAIGATREQVACMVQGQAAGTAAALAAQRGVTPRELSIAELRKALAGQDHIL